MASSTPLPSTTPANRAQLPLRVRTYRSHSLHQPVYHRRDCGRSKRRSTPLTIREQDEAANTANMSLVTPSGAGFDTEAEPVPTSSPSAASPAAAATGHLSDLGGGRVRYVDPSLWASMCAEAAELDELLSSQMRYVQYPGVVESETEDHSPLAEAREADATIDSIRLPYSQGTPDPELQLAGDIVQFPLGRSFELHGAATSASQHLDLRKSLPPKAMCEELLDAYVYGYHPVVPMIHVASFRERYEAYWRNHIHEEPTEATPASFGALLIAILFCGSIAGSTSSDNHPGETEQTSKRLHKLGIKALRLANFPHTPTLDSFRAYLLLQATCMKEEEPLTCVAFVGLALRAATMLGLHRDPLHFSSIDPIEAEVRRQVWWYLVHFDVVLAFAAGLPPIIDTGMGDVKPILEVKEEYFHSSAEFSSTSDAQNEGWQTNVARTGSTGEEQMSMIGLFVGGKLAASGITMHLAAISSGPLTRRSNDVKSLVPPPQEASSKRT